MAARAAVSGFTRRRLLQTLSGGLQFFHLRSLYGGGYRSTHLHSLYGGIRSSRFFSGSRDVEPEDVNLGSSATGHRIDGPPPPSLEKHNPIKYRKTPGLDAGDPLVHSTLLHFDDLSVSTPVEVEPLNANAHLFLPRVDTNGLTYFTAHSVEKDATLKPLYYIYPPYPINQHCFFTGATDNGLFHFHSDKKRRGHYLWNPTTNEVKTLPKTISGRQSRHFFLNVMDYAMCSCDGGDFKLMLLVATRDSSKYADNCFYLELYSLKTNRWSYILIDKEYKICSLDGACINGVYYSVATRGEGQPEFILSFEFASQTFSTLPLPPKVTPSDKYHILEYKGFLSLVVYSGLEILPSSYCSWVWENGVWIEQCYFHTCSIREPLLYSKNGQMLYFNSLKDELMVLDCNAGHLKPLGIHCFSLPMRLYTLVENSVQLNVEEVEKEEDDEGVPEVENEEDYSDLPWLQPFLKRERDQDLLFETLREKWFHYHYGSEP